jgi:cyclohexanecarboxyl-CoA dehydrogenase
VIDDVALEDFRNTVRRLARQQLLDGYLARATSSDYPRDTLRLLGASGLLGLLVPEERGGQGAGAVALGIACEELCYADVACGYQVFGNNVFADLLARLGSGEVCRQWLRPVIDGEVVTAVALTEPETGSDAQALSTRADRGDGGWTLTGEKTSVTQAPHADVALIMARETDTHRISAFVVPLDQPGISRQRFADPGFRPIGRGSIALDGVFVPESHRLGSGGDGFGLLMNEFDLSRTLIAFMAVGVAQRAIDLTVEHVRTRRAFGKTLSRFQGVSFPIAEHLTYLAAVRALGYQALRDRQAGRPHTVEAAMLKWWAPQVAFQAVQDCIVLHGHVGWSDEMPLQALLRDVSGFQIGDGTPQIQKLIIARHAIGPEVMDREPGRTE